MPPRGNSGLDFTPLLTHYLFLLTTVLSIVGWIVAFVAQAFVTANVGNAFIGVLWFAIWLQLALIIGVVLTLASDAIAMHRFQISTFGAVAIVFAVIGVNQNIYGPTGANEAVGAGWLILAMVDILWVLYFTSEEDSLALHMFNSLGTGGLTPPSRRRRTARTQSLHNMPAQNNGYTANYSPGAGISSHEAMPYDTKMVGGGIGSGGPIRSNNSFTTQSPARSMGAPLGSTHNLGMAGPVASGANEMGAGSPLMGSAASGGGTGPQTASGGTETYSYKAKALYAYVASADDPNEISFTKGEILDIVDKEGKWWQAKKADGTLGIAPSNYLQII